MEEITARRHSIGRNKTEDGHQSAHLQSAQGRQRIKYAIRHRRQKVILQVPGDRRVEFIVWHICE